MTVHRRTALVAGIFYLLTFSSIPTLALYRAVREPRYILGPGPDTSVMFGAILEVIVAIACAGTAVTLYPALKRLNQSVALGFVAARVVEATCIIAGVATLLTVVTLRQNGAGPDALPTAHALVAMYDRIFLLSQSFIPAVNAVLLGSLLYQSRLVPRILPLVGLIGAPLLVASDVGILFNAWGAQSAVAGLAALPIALWELSLGVWLVAKGFNRSPILE